MMIGEEHRLGAYSLESATWTSRCKPLHVRTADRKYRETGRGKYYHSRLGVRNVCEEDETGAARDTFISGA